MISEGSYDSEVTADEISDLHYWIKLYFKVNLIMYYSITSDTETSENSSHDCSEHNETNAHWRIFCSAKCKQM